MNSAFGVRPAEMITLWDVRNEFSEPSGKGLRTMCHSDPELRAIS